MAIGFAETMLILVVVLLLFGSNRIPDLAKALGRASFEYKKAKNLIQKESAELIEEAENHARAKSNIENE